MKKVRAFLKAIFADWIGRMSGGGGLILTIFAFFSPPAWQPRAFVVLGTLCLFYACYRAWLGENAKHEALRQELLPRLEFVHDPRVKPYFEELPSSGGGNVRYLRLGLHNRGGIAVPRARLVLEGCEPSSSPAVHLEHELQPMGQPQGTLTVAVPAHGTVFIDVAREVVGAGIEDSLSLCYAQPVTNGLPSRSDEPYVLTLRAEGAGRSIRCSLSLGARVTWRLDGLKLLPESTVALA